jgi:hypothetical protein
MGGGGGECTVEGQWVLMLMREGSGVCSRLSVKSEGRNEGGMMCERSVNSERERVDYYESVDGNCTRLPPTYSLQRSKSDLPLLLTIRLFIINIANIDNN